MPEFTITGEGGLADLPLGPGRWKLRARGNRAGHPSSAFTDPPVVVPVTPATAAPVITSHSNDTKVTEGTKTTLFVRATGATTYTWQNDAFGVWAGDNPGVMFGDANTYEVGPFSAGQSMRFRCLVSNASGTVETFPIRVTGEAATATSVLRGVALMGIGAVRTGGTLYTDYWLEDATGLTFLQGRGHKVVRQEFWWERVQPTRFGALDTAKVQELIDLAGRCEARGLLLILDMHNYARRFKGLPNEEVLGTHFGADAIADVWVKLSRSLRGVAGVWAYGIMNEPYNLPGGAGAWQNASQQVVAAIRNDGDNVKQVVVSGYQWSAAEAWKRNHPAKWITDPAEKLYYEAHCYPDQQSAGRFPISFAQEDSEAKAQGHASVGARYVARARPFVDWCKEQGVKGIMTEVGWTRLEAAASWNAAGDELYRYLDAERMPATYWAAGGFSDPNYALGPYSGRPHTGVHAGGQAATIEAHKTFT